MSDRSRWDPEMVTYQQAAEAIAAKFPPVNDWNCRSSRIARSMTRSRWRGWCAGRTWRRPRNAGSPRARAADLLPGASASQTDRPLPVLVYFHGGGWVWGSVDTHDCAARSLAAGGEVATVSVDYALSPEAKFPQALEECAAVLRHIAREGAAWGFDTSRILVGGDSAGGNLALATALLLRDTGGPALAGIVTAYPVCDSRFDTTSYQEFATGHVLTRDKMAFYWNSYVPHEADRAHPLAAPLRADLTGLPPVLVVLAELDVLRSEGEALVGRLRAAAVPVETETYSGVLHGFLRATDGLQKARDAVAAGGRLDQAGGP